MSREVRIWKRSTGIHTSSKENEKMSTTNPAAERAISEAADVLRPHGNDDPAIAAVLKALDTIVSGEAEGEDETDAVAKALLGTQRTIQQLRKSEDTPELRERLEKAHRALEIEHLHKHSGGAR